jgi:hypothetical protein
MMAEITPGALWRCRADGQVFEVHYIPPYAPNRVQLKPQHARNLRRTRWLEAENLPRRYDHLTEDNEPFNMNDLERGDVWDMVGGKRVEVLERAFIWAGVRWVVVHDHDFDVERGPVVFKVERFIGAKRAA